MLKRVRTFPWSGQKLSTLLLWCTCIYKTSRATMGLCRNLQGRSLMRSLEDDLRGPKSGRADRNHRLSQTRKKNTTFGASLCR